MSYFAADCIPTQSVTNTLPYVHNPYSNSTHYKRSLCNVNLHEFLTFLVTSTNTTRRTSTKQVSSTATTQTTHIHGTESKICQKQEEDQCF